ncbi:MAG: double zinc ribbon domain-containing protein [Gemmatimonadaceae bacterium]
MDPLDFFFERLVRAVGDTRPEFLTRPFEVAELMELVPYRSVRGPGEFETNDDYANALTRLIAGERGYIFADDLLQDDLRAELASPNPDLAAYRAYLTARLTISLAHARKAGASMPPANTPATPTSAIRTPPASSPAVSLSEAVTAPKVPRPSAAAPPRPLDPGAETAQRSSRPGCRYCGQALPEDRPAHFCPSCGQNLLARRCAACSAELEPGWKFCVACGRLAAS